MCVHVYTRLSQAFSITVHGIAGVLVQFPICFMPEEGSALLLGGELLISLGFPIEATFQRLFPLYLEMTLPGALSRDWVSSVVFIHPDSLIYFKVSLH